MAWFPLQLSMFYIYHEYTTKPARYMFAWQANATYAYIPWFSKPFGSGLSLDPATNNWLSELAMLLAFHSHRGGNKYI